MYNTNSQLSLSLSWESSSSEDYSYSNESPSDSDDEDISINILGQFYNAEIIKVKKERNAVADVIEKEPYCFNVMRFSEKLVDATFIEAQKFLTPKDDTLRVDDIPCDGFNQVLSSESYSSKSEDSLSKFWPTISEFNIKLGLEKVEEFVESWERSSEWRYCVEFVGFECEDCSNIFVFQVEWSKPTMTYPIPQATANVFFALDVYKMVPHDYESRVEVTYIFECSTMIHRPGRIDFQEKWLEDILTAKLRFFRTVTFGPTQGYSFHISFMVIFNNNLTNIFNSNKSIKGHTPVTPPPKASQLHIFLKQK